MTSIPRPSVKKLPGARETKEKSTTLKKGGKMPGVFLFFFKRAKVRQEVRGLNAKVIFVLPLRMTIGF